MRISVDAVLALVHTFLAGVVIYLKKPWFAMHPTQAFYWLMGLEKVSLSQVMADPWAYLSLTTLAWAYLYAMVLVGIYFLFNLFFVPYNNVGNWHDPLTGTDGRLRGSHFKDAGDMPPAFPNCWFRACDTIDVEKGKTRAETLFNQDLVVFRGKDGKIGIVNVGCPSCKASLVEAKVQESSIKCSGCAHEYDREGKCVSHPTSERVHSWHVEEGNGHIYIWHDAEDMPPTHKPTMVEDIANGSYFYHGRTEHCITAHVAEMPENGPDVAHLNYLHANFLIQSLSPFILHKWAATWHHGQSEKDKHCGYVILDQRIHIGGKYAPGTHIHVEVVQCGLGLVCLRLETPFGFVYVFESVTPVRPLYQKFHHLAWAEWRVPRTIAKGVLMGLVAQAERDMPVWNHKTYKNKPVLVKGDGPISVYRKWVKQFFREANWSEAPDMMPRPATRAFWINQAEANNNAESTTTTTAATEAH